MNIIKSAINKLKEIVCITKPKSNNEIICCFYCSSGNIDQRSRLHDVKDVCRDCGSVRYANKNIFSHMWVSYNIHISEKYSVRYVSEETNVDIYNNFLNERLFSLPRSFIKYPITENNIEKYLLLK